VGGSWLGWRGTAAAKDHTFMINCHGDKDASLRQKEFEFIFFLVYFKYPYLEQFQYRIRAIPFKGGKE
jgi:hypothetical protein